MSSELGGDMSGAMKSGVLRRVSGNLFTFQQGIVPAHRAWDTIELLPCSTPDYSLLKASQSFICRSYKVDRTITDGFNTDLHLDIGNGISLENVDKFCY